DPDTVEFRDGVAPQDLTLERLGDDLGITIAGTDDQLKVLGQFGSLTYSRVESFRFADGTTWTWQDVQRDFLGGTPGDDVLNGFSNADFLDGGAGNDQLIGHGGGDTFVFDAGYGADMINAYIEALTFDYPDTVLFGSGLTPSTVELQRVAD